MATLRSKRFLAALKKENPRCNLTQNTNVPSSQKDYITHVSEKIGDRVTNELSQEFNRMENRILGAFSRLDDHLLNPFIPGHSGATPERSQNALGTNQGTNEDDSLGDLHPRGSLGAKIC